MIRCAPLRGLLLVSIALAAAGCAGDGETYVIQPGDTGIEIAQRNGVPFGRLAELNPGTDWRRLQPGDELRIPARASSAGSSPEGWAALRRWIPGRGPAAAVVSGPATGLVVVYRGDRLRTVDPQITASGLPVLDHLPLLGYRIRHFEGRWPRGLEAYTGKSPLRISGRSTSRFTIEVPEDAAMELATVIDQSPGGKPLPVAFWWRG